MSNTKTISVKNIPEDLWQAFRAKAISAGKSVPEFLVEAIQMRLGRKTSPQESKS